MNARLSAGVFILLLLSACSTPQVRALRGTVPSDLPSRAELSDVAYFAQEENQCGPAALAMVFQRANLNLEPAQLKDSLYLPDKQGSLQVEMLAATRRQGLVAYVLQPQLKDVLAEVSAGNPVVVLQNLGLSWYPLWHYAVVIGYDLGREEVILRSGANRRLVLPFSTFENTWARSKYWAMLALPPAQLPHTAQAEKFIQSLAALAHSRPATDLGPAYTAALARWPEHLLTLIAAGNYQYAQSNLLKAEQLFLNATTLHPTSVAALNNLAQTQSELGMHDLALQTIQRALQLGGPLNPAVRKTQAEIEQKMQKVLQ